MKFFGLFYAGSRMRCTQLCAKGVTALGFLSYRHHHGDEQLPILKWFSEYKYRDIFLAAGSLQLGLFLFLRWLLIPVG